jgi:poly(A) polymerase
MCRLSSRTDASNQAAWNDRKQPVTDPHAMPKPHPRLAAAAWLRAPATQRVLAAIVDGGGKARVVGGAVRNTLIGRAVTDIDIATSVLPEDVMARAERAGLVAIPTGLDHGTVTVVADHHPFEVTTLRHDVETHGRRATVAFTEDWAGDARRRDFTINALYCDADGTLHDFTGGAEDLAAHRVRFIGRPEDRIAEDYLRILRFYRFTAEYAEGTIDREGHAACAALQAGLEQISAERIRAELMKLLVAPHALLAVSEMDETGLMARILGRATDVVTFARLAAIETANAIAADPVRRLYALAVREPDAAAGLRDRLRLSKVEFGRLADVVLPDRAFEPGDGETRAKASIYRHGPETYRDGVLISWARELSAAPDDPAWCEHLGLPDRWSAPRLPVGGRDVIALGIPSGPDVGHILAVLSDWWMTAGFPDDPALVRTRLATLVNLKKE